MPEKPKAYPKTEIQATVVHEEKEGIKKSNEKKPLPKKERSNNPTPLVNIKNLVLSNSISINTKTFTEKKEEKEDEIDLSKRPTDNYSTELFIEKWKAYKTQLLKKGKVSLVTVFEYIPPVNNDVIELLIENKALVEEFNYHKADFIKYIRTELNNYNIQVVTQINKEFKTKKAYTPQEKYEKMVEKNPHLNLLKKKFDMDIGY